MNLIFKTLVGSRAYGTFTDESDYDYKGIFVSPAIDIGGLTYKQQIEIGKDETYYEVKRFVELLTSANPTVLEMLFTEDNDIYHPSMDHLIQNRNIFLTTRCIDSFGGYAVAQIKKAKGLNKKMNWVEAKVERKEPIDFCYIQKEQGSIPIRTYLRSEKMKEEYCGLQAITHMPGCYLLYYDYGTDFGPQTNSPQSYKKFGYKGFGFEDSNALRLSSIPKDQYHVGILYYNKDAYSIHCKEYRSYQEWLEHRNETRYVQTVNEKIDSKNIMHCVRLVDMLQEIVETQNITVKRPNVDYLMSIRRGKVDLQTVINETEAKLKTIESNKLVFNLPKEVDLNLCNNIIQSIRNDTTN